MSLLTVAAGRWKKGLTGYGQAGVVRMPDRMRVIDVERIARTRMFFGWMRLLIPARIPTRTGRVFHFSTLHMRPPEIPTGLLLPLTI